MRQSPSSTPCPRAPCAPDRRAAARGDPGRRHPPGAPLVETALSERFDVSRGPLREALRQLIEEGLVVTVPYTGTHVAALSVEDVSEIYSLRTALEIFAIEQLWDRCDDRFRRELVNRNEALIATIDAGDDRASIDDRARLPRPGLRGERPSACCSAPGTACAAACSSIGRRTIARTAGAGRGATATTATSPPCSATTSPRCGPRSPTTCAAARRPPSVS